MRLHALRMTETYNIIYNRVCYFRMETRINFHMHARDNPVLNCPTCNTKKQFNFGKQEQCAGNLPTDTPLH